MRNEEWSKEINFLTARSSFLVVFQRAGNGTRTRDPNLGKVVLYQLSYSRACRKLAVTIPRDKNDAHSRPNAERVHRIPH
jgi:hypothetical protein